jgi:predicted transcriptional regulator
MKLYEVVNLLEAKLLTPNANVNADVSYVFGCDLMSDVLAMVCGETLLLTGLTNIQAVRTAEMKDIKCIVFVRGKKPDRQVIELAEEKGICLMSTKNIMFTSCGILYNKGLKGAEVEE